MKWVKSRDKYLIEAKIRDLVLPRQAKFVKEKWGEVYLDYEETIPNGNLKLGKWKLTEEEKNEALTAFFNVDIKLIGESFKSIPDKFASILSSSINLESLKDPYKTILKDFDIRKPTIDQISILHDPIFRKLSVTETKSKELVLRSPDGKPILDDQGKITKVSKEEGDPVFSNSLVNAVSFVTEYNRCYSDQVRFDFNSYGIQNIRNISAETSGNSSFKFDYEIFNKDVYLSILHNPKDILNISISKFYASCQHLYSGAYNSHVLGNVFDPNSVPAFLLIDTEVFWDEDKIAEQMPMARLFVRAIENFSSEKPQLLYFDLTYPGRMGDVLRNLIKKYTGMEHTASRDSTYMFTPDLPHGDNLQNPYMDSLGLAKGLFIGANADKIYLGGLDQVDWSRVKISPKAKIKEVVVESTTLPENFLKLKFDLDWIKFRFLKLNDLSSFKNVGFKSIAFEKCKFKGELLNSLKEEGINKFQINSCDIENMNLSSLKEVEEIQLIYTLNPEEKLSDILGDLKFKSIVISGDVVSNSENKSYLSLLKKSGIKTKIVGPVI